MEKSIKKDAMGRLKTMAEDIGVCMMVTGWGSAPFCAVPMTTKKVDSNGNLWFLSLKNSEHNENITKNEQVELLYSDPSKMEFLCITGTAKMHLEKPVLKELYDEETDHWLDGLEDSKLSAIEIIPEKAHYWDTQTNKYETLYHLGIAALTSDEKSKDEEGELEL